MSEKRFKYKSSLINGISISDVKTSSNVESVDKFLEDEKIANSIEPWSKLDKTTKLRKLIAFSNNYKETNNLTEDECNSLIAFFRDCLDKKRLYKVKDVTYNKETGEIIDIPGLIYNKSSNHYTIKNIDKRVSTLKGLGPKRKPGTIKNKNVSEKNKIDSDEENED
jgi:hypothetical protein